MISKDNPIKLVSLGMYPKETSAKDGNVYHNYRSGQLCADFARKENLVGGRFTLPAGYGKTVRHYKISASEWQVSRHEIRDACWFNEFDPEQDQAADSSQFVHATIS